MVQNKRFPETQQQPHPFYTSFANSKCECSHNKPSFYYILLFLGIHISPQKFILTIVPEQYFSPNWMQSPYYLLLMFRSNYYNLLILLWEEGKSIIIL